MAKLRANHTPDKNPFVGMTVRILLLMAIVAALIFMAMHYFNEQPDNGADIKSEELFFDAYEREHLLPELKNVEVVHHKYYSLGYSEAHEQASWVCYVLNKDELRIPNVPRYNRYEDDLKVNSGSATYYDYRGSGYSRGHLAPAGDMAFSEEAMRESFYMSNMSPQLISFNGGIWRELEETVRDWAYKDKHLYIVTGPILESSMQSFGTNRISVPRYFYKAMMDIEGDLTKGIAFIMPNELSERPLMDYAVTIDELEKRLGFDIFPNLLENDVLEESLESKIDIDLWPVSEKRFELRVNNWNKNGQ
jgi:endonuclease G